MPATANTAAGHPHRDWIPLAEAAMRLGCGIDTIEALIRDRRLTLRRIGTSWRKVSAAEVERIDRESTIPAEP
jgi:excisionase family DNA binding protein